jgi:limonene-1,2-epoxide hydrolase
MDAPSLVDRLLRALNQHDLTAFLDLFHADFRSEQPLRPESSFVGREHVGANWAWKLSDPASDFHAEALRWAASGEELWVEWRWTHTRPGGEQVDLQGICVYGVESERFAWARLYMGDVPR